MEPLPKIRGLMLLIGLILLSGCLGTSQPFKDDFSDPASGWGAASHETYVRGYQQGRYLFQVDVPRWFVWATGGRNYEDVRLSALVRSSGLSDDHFGLLCRYTEEQFYYFALSSDGYYAIFRRDPEGVLLPLTGKAMLRSPAIHTDGTDNRIVATCAGSMLALYANGELVAQVDDEVLSKGDVGMAAGTISAGGAMVWFDDFEARAP
jgi:hypothetical protein